jgi:ABC-type glycerol-3-phosphate transport system permease component
MITKNPIAVFPVGFTFDNYKRILEQDGLFLAFAVSISRTVAGTAITLFFTSILAYALTKNELIGRKLMDRVTVTAMYLHAGLIPWYMTMRSLHLKDNFLVYVLPSAVSIFSLILIKTYMEQISTAIEESAFMDGAGYFTIYQKIIMPLSLPVLAAVVVFTAVAQWNSWYDNLLLVNVHELRTLQLVLLQFLKQAESIATEIRLNGAAAAGGSNYALTPYTVRVTITMVVTIPIILVYPMVQKYFVNGIILGAVKG